MLGRNDVFSAVKEGGVTLLDIDVQKAAHLTR